MRKTSSHFWFAWPSFSLPDCSAQSRSTERSRADLTCRRWHLGEALDLLEALQAKHFTRCIGNTPCSLESWNLTHLSSLLDFGEGQMTDLANVSQGRVTVSLLSLNIENLLINTLSTSLPTGDNLKAICWGDSMTRWKTPGSLGQQMPWSYCLASGETFLCNVLRFWNSYRRETGSHLSGHLPSRCLPATFCHPLWHPGPPHCSPMGRVRCCLWEDVVPRIP